MTISVFIAVLVLDLSQLKHCVLLFYRANGSPQSTCTSTGGMVIVISFFGREKEKKNYLILLIEKLQKLMLPDSSPAVKFSSVP